MRDFSLIAFILALPALAVFGHDIYLAYNNTALEGAERFWFSDLGWLWVTYNPESYDWVVRNTDPEIWNNLIDPILKYDAILIASIPVLIFLASLLFMKIFGFGSFEGKGIFNMNNFAHSKKTGGSFSYDHGKGGKNKTKYKRK